MALCTTATIATPAWTELRVTMLPLGHKGLAHWVSQRRIQSAHSFPNHGHTVHIPVTGPADPYFGVEPGNSRTEKPTQTNACNSIQTEPKTKLSDDICGSYPLRGDPGEKCPEPAVRTSSRAAVVASLQTTAPVHPD